MTMTRIGKQALTFQKRVASPACSLHGKWSKRNYSDSTENAANPKKKPHPYRLLHPWKSQNEFSKHLLDNLIYNKDGIVILNKPYGISGKSNKNKVEGNQYRILSQLLVNPVNYTIESSLAQIAKQLGYNELIISKCPERYTSGVTILVENQSIANKIELSMKRAKASKELNRIYWAITTMTPGKEHGQATVGLKIENYKHENKKPVIVPQWSKSDIKSKRVKVLHTEYTVLSSCKATLASLLEIKISTTKWHAHRLFAATVLFSPVLGDNYYGCCIKNVMGTWFPVKHYVDPNQESPELKKELLEMLHISKLQQNLIPLHLHLRSMHLPSLLKNGENFIVQAPLLPPFAWTCEQLHLTTPNPQIPEENLYTYRKHKLLKNIV